MKSSDSPEIKPLARIETVRELSRLLNIEYRSHFSFTLYRRSGAQNYKTFLIAKRSGGSREISAPRSPLKRIQSGLLPFINEIYLPPPCVHGYREGRSIKTNASYHQGQKYILNVDLKEFFPSIHFKRIVGILTSKRYNIHRDIAVAVAQICCRDGRLSTGSPTSGVISNIVCGVMDAELMRHCKKYGILYTRYADDLTFSTSNRKALINGLGINIEPDHQSHQVDDIGEELRSIIEKTGFQINASKVRIATRQSRQMVTGVIVNRKTNVSSEFYRSLRGAVHAVEKFGLSLAQEKYTQAIKRANSSTDLKKNILGRLSHFGYIADYGPRYVRLAQRVKRIFPKNEIYVPYSGTEYTYHLYNLADKYNGTAFYIGKEYFITAAHLFKKGNELMTARIHRPNLDTDTILCNVVRIDHDIDICLLKAPSSKIAKNLPVASFSARSPMAGDKVTTYGFPQYMEGNNCSAVISHVTGDRFSFKAMRIEVDRPYPHGISGAPVVNEHGFVVGVVHGGGPLESESVPVGTTFTSYTIFKKTLSDWLGNGDT